MSRKNNKAPGTTPDGQDPNLAEQVLRDSGKSEDEVRRTGAVDRADEDVDGMFDERMRTSNSPLHRMVWNVAGVRHFAANALPANADKAVIAQQSCIDVALAHRAAGTMYDEHGKVSLPLINDLAAAGYWGMRIPTEFGGQGSNVRSFMNFLTAMSAKACPTTAGLASIHGCIGAVDPVLTFGNPEQQAYFLPRLASGTAISAFALTEPGAGSDLTALKTTAVLDGDDYVINGEKLFISNAIPGHTIGLVCLINGKANVFVVELPDQENENFQLVRYGLHALTHTYNNGLKFTNFRVPAKNLLKIYNAKTGQWDMDKGLLIAYHGLNFGRVALCANAAGVMRLILRSITPKAWGKVRRTYGMEIESRELVKRRIARLAALTVGADALAAWCSTILDEGYRGELECIVAKVFGSEAQKEAAIELGLKTHGGRSFLEGHLIGDNIHDYLAPLIYEGEGEMLLMAFFKSLAKEHGMNFMLPLGEAMKSLKKGAYGSGLWNLGRHGIKYTMWQLGRRMRLKTSQHVPGMNSRLQAHVNFALKQFASLSLDLSGAMVKHQLKLADRQCRIVELSQRVHDTVIMLVTAQYAHQIGDDVTIAAADVLCQDLRRKLTGARPSDDYFRACSKLADAIVAGKMTQLEGVPETPIMRPYKQ
jgi:alkylation response protein AidB-like acyl-CoA dehydrogenase